MRLHIFNIPLSADGLGRAIEDANRFLDRVQVHQVTASLVEDKFRGAVWSVMVAYEPYAGATSAPERPSKTAAATNGPTITVPALDEAGKELYENLRTWRNSEARRKDVPGYTILTNRQIQKIAETRPSTSDALGKATGLNDKALTEVGPAVLALVAGKQAPETEPSQIAADSTAEKPEPESKPAETTKADEALNAVSQAPKEQSLEDDNVQEKES